MHGSIGDYLSSLAAAGRSPLTIKAARSDLTGFTTWWETRRQRPFHPVLLLDSDLREWRSKRQCDDAAAPATINRALSTIRVYCTWASQAGLMTENPRTTRNEPNERLRLRDEALLALLIYAGLRTQESCDVQLCDLDLAGGAVTVRYGKRGRMPSTKRCWLALIGKLPDNRCNLGCHSLLTSKVGRHNRSGPRASRHVADYHMILRSSLISIASQTNVAPCPPAAPERGCVIYLEFGMGQAEHKYKEFIHAILPRSCFAHRS